MKTFHCPKWPHCECPDGTVALDCPGLSGHQKRMDEAIRMRSRRMDDIVERHKAQATSGLPIYYAAVAVAIFTIIMIGLARYEAALKLAAV